MVVDVDVAVVVAVVLPPVVTVTAGLALRMVYPSLLPKPLSNNLQ
jgi:hypothetical protein